MCITLITSAKPLWPRRVAYSQVLGSRRRTSLGGHYSMYHMLCGSCSWLPFLNSDAAACSGSGGNWQVCSTPTGIWDLGSSLWTKFSIWTVPLLEAMGGHKGTLLRARSEARHWAWPIPQLLSLMPTVPGCSSLFRSCSAGSHAIFSPSPCPLDRLPLAWDKLFFPCFPFTPPGLEHPTLPLPRMDSWLPSSRSFCSPDGS